VHDLALPFDHAAGATTDEADLVRAAQSERSRFAALYDRYIDRIYSYTRSRTPSDEDAADLTQQVFARALDALPRYQARQTPFAAWLFRIARNATIDYHRRRHVAVAWDCLPEAQHPHADLDLEAGAVHHDDLARLRLLLRTLDPQTRELLALRFAAGLTMAEISAVCGKSEDATKKRILRALHSLKERYNEHE
jgi:RNA polymerase sigma-70 factor (ECF subfamily)